MTLIEFIEERLKDEHALASAGAERWDGDPDAGFEGLSHAAQGLTLMTPQRWLAEIEAKRRIIELHELVVRRDAREGFDPSTGEPTPAFYSASCAGCDMALVDDGAPPSARCDTVALLALPYSGHPHYDEAWRP